MRRVDGWHGMRLKVSAAPPPPAATLSEDSGAGWGSSPARRGRKLTADAVVRRRRGRQTRLRRIVFGDRPAVLSGTRELHGGSLRSGGQAALAPPTRGNANRADGGGSASRCFR